MPYLHLFPCSLILENEQYGLVAQLVEQRTENPRVGGSIPSQATIFFNDLQPLAIVAFVFWVKFWVLNNVLHSEFFVYGNGLSFVIYSLDMFTKEKRYTVAEAAEVLRLSKRTVQRLIDKLELKYHRFGKRIIISESQLNEYAEKNRIKYFWMSAADLPELSFDSF